MTTRLATVLDDLAAFFATIEPLVGSVPAFDGASDQLAGLERSLATVAADLTANRGQLGATSASLRDLADPARRRRGDARDRRDRRTRRAGLRLPPGGDRRAHGLVRAARARRAPDRRLAPACGGAPGPGRAMTNAAQRWVGQPLPRLEDEALLRGAGRFLDDLDPAPTPATPPSCAPSSRTPGSRGSTRRRHSSCPASSASSPAPTSRPCRGRSRPGSTARSRTTPRRGRGALRGRAARGRRRARPLRRRGRARADRGRLRAARPRARPARRPRPRRSCSHPTAPFATATRTSALARGAPRRPRALRVPALELHARSSATGSSPTGTRRPAR